MKQQIHDTILSILAEKRRNGDVLPFATSIEVAHLLHMNALDVEKIALPDMYVEHGNVNILYKDARIDADSVVERILAAMERD